jgi:propanol-preferring alcohol dehydrogenase
MRALRFYQPDETTPLTLEELPRPVPAARELLLRILTCGVCHTDLHLVEGELPNPKEPVIPGHQVVGVVEQMGEGVSRFQVGARVGVFWLYSACGVCEYCRRGLENLCDSALFTGYTADGGYAEFITVPEDFAVPIPDSYLDVEAAPLLCAGIVGYRSLRLSDLQPGERLGLYGFGASAHICIQVARYWDCEVYVFTRSEENQALAREYGVKWVGDSHDESPAKLDRAIIFAPAGWIVPLALGHLRKGGTLCINAIHMSPIPEMPYNLLWHERTIRSVANVTRRDAEEFLPLAAQIPIHTTTQVYDLAEANSVLGKLKRGEIKGAAVLKIS